MLEQILQDEYILDIYKRIKEHEDNDISGYAYHDLTHAINVMELASTILKELNCTIEEIEGIKIAAILHDLGCLEGKENHEIRSYELAKKYLENKEIKLKERILSAIKNHRVGFDSDDIMTVVLVLADKLDIKKSRVAPAGVNIKGNKEFLSIEDITIKKDKNNFIVNFIVNENCNKKELENYYFIPKVFKAINSFAKKNNLQSIIMYNDELWLLEKIGLPKGFVKLEDHQTEWENIFNNTKKELKEIFKEEAITIEHVGSTSIKDLAAKPIIDIAIGVDKLKDWTYYQELVKDNQKYSVKENSAEGEVFMRIGPINNRTHFIHIMEITSEDYKETLLFRDYLRTNKIKLLEYQKLKEDLAKSYKNDRDKYTKAKDNFIKDVINIAKK